MMEDPDASEEFAIALGQAVTTHWADLPPNIQQKLFKTAAARNENGFRGALALFLHTHNPRTADATQTATTDAEGMEDDLQRLFPPGRDR